MTRFVPADLPPGSSPAEASSSGEGSTDRPEEIAAGFPRHLTRNLLDEATTGERRRHALQLGLFVLALALFALAQPQLGWMGRGMALLEAKNGQLVGRAIVGANPTLLQLERLQFLVSALLVALSLPVLMSLGVRLGLSRGRALASALLGVLAPAAFVAARLPGPEARGLFVSALLFLLLARETRIKILLPVAALGLILDPATLVLFPAVFAGLGGSRSYGGKWGVLLGLVVVSFVAYLAYDWSLLVDGTTFLPAALIPGLSTTPTFLTLHGVPALGLLLVFLPAPFFASRDENEEPPPKWLALWLAGALLSPFEGAPYLIAPAIFGFQDWLGRHPEPSKRWLLPLLLGQIVLAITSDAGLRSADPLNEWRDRAREVLQPGDFVVTDSERSVHLLSTRGGYEVLRTHDLTSSTVIERLMSEGDPTRRRWVIDLSEREFERLISALPENAPRIRRAP
ncbi:MAG: hypothetical protein AAF368_00700 [Planctomycetota bacterium]